jgi:phosphate transport system permease protein
VSRDAPPLSDWSYRAAVGACAACIPLLLALIAWRLALAAWPAFAEFGARFVTGSAWDPVREVFTAGPALAGTVVTSALALALAAPLGLGVAVYAAELAPARLRQPVAYLVDLLAAIPSVVYGLWGAAVLVPWLRASAYPFLQDSLRLGDTALFRGPAYGQSLLAAALVLAIMVLPFIAAVSREVLRAVPASQREAALALGATRWEVVAGVVVPYAKSGIVGAVMLGLGRALGETIAVAMVVGGSHAFSTSLLSPGYTLASLAANEFGEATGGLHRAALMGAAAVLFGVTLIVNAVARWLVARVAAAGAE